MRFRVLAVLLVSCLWSVAGYAQTSAPLVTEIRVEQEGREVTDRMVLDLIDVAVGQPVSVAAIRESYSHLNALGRFDDIRVYQEPAGGGVRLRWVLYPLHPVDRMEFRGALGLPAREVRRAMTERFGEAPSGERAPEVAAALVAFYRERGFPSARVTPRLEERHDPDRATLVLEVMSGPRAAIGTVEIDEFDGADQPVRSGFTGVRPGQPYDADAIREALDRYTTQLRGQGFYEATAVHAVSFEPDGTATVRVTIDRGPRVSVIFSGDPLPAADLARLAPIEAERSADEDLLEDVSFAIEEYLRERGYRDASVQYLRQPSGADLAINFDIRRGRRFVIDQIDITGNTALGNDEILQLLLIRAGEPFVQAQLNRGVANVAATYRSRGYTRPQVQPNIVELGEGVTPEGRVRVRIDIIEGPRTFVADVAFAGNEALTAAQLATLIRTAPGRPYSETDLVADRDAIDLEYRNRGYENVVVTPSASLVDGGGAANVLFTISEGPQVIVDHVIIVGNTRTSAATIERELLLRPGEPLGQSALLESQARLAALGLFRRVQITPLALGSQPRRDVLVRVEEADPNTIDIGGGIEGGTRLRPTGAGGQAEERFEFAPRGFFQIGRRNLFGKNRSINLFTRVTLRSRDVVLSSNGIRLEPNDDSGYGFNEYRALLTYREPRVFNLPADVLITGIVDQAIRSSFNFITREARAEIGARLGGGFSAAGRYSFQNTRLFDQRFTDEEKPLIDRLFPQVRLSKFSASIIRDTRDDALNAERGTFFIFDGTLAGKAIGSEVGFIKSSVQLFGYYRLPAARRTVLALGARLGTARGFDDQTLNDLPASERFFAGGDTTVRGFSLDRLGTDETISATGFPLGGNGLVILNSELRVAAFGAFSVVGFLDAGNVFMRASDIDLTRLRATSGFGLHYNSPVGPIRAELGFKLDRRELSPGRLERAYVLHISLGQAF